MKTGFYIIIFFLGFVMICQMCMNCSEDNEEYVYIPTYESKYENECDSLQQQKIVSLSLLNFTLCDSITKNDLKSNTERLIKNLKMTKVEDKIIYNFDSKMEINEKKYKIKCTLITFRDEIAWIDVYFDQDVYIELIQLFKSKYAYCLHDRWYYKNQSIDIDYENPQRKIYSSFRKSYIYLNSYDFKYLRIKYYDHQLLQEVEKIEHRQEMIKLQYDSIRHAKAVEIQKEIDRKKEIEEEKKISKELKQI